MSHEPLVFTLNEDRSREVSVDCPECGEFLLPRPDADWGGREQTSFDCYECGEELILAAVITNQ